MRVSSPPAQQHERLSQYWLEIHLEKIDEGHRTPGKTSYDVRITIANLCSTCYNLPMDFNDDSYRGEAYAERRKPFGN